MESRNTASFIDGLPLTDDGLERATRRGLMALKMCPLVGTKGTDLVPTLHTEERKGEEHSEQSEELCGWAVVYDEAQSGRT